MAAQPRGPLLTLDVHEQLLAARRRAPGTLQCSLDLGRTSGTVTIDAAHWTWDGRPYPYLERCRDRTVYGWTGTEFAPVARYGRALIKLVPTQWGAPTFEIDGVKMLPTKHVSPFEDARHKVALVQPRGRHVLDTCAGLGYFAACCIEAGATLIRSYEIDPDVLWLRGINPWSPPAQPPLELVHDDIHAAIAGLPDRTYGAILHDPPRFGLAGELYSQAFYDQLARVLQPGGRLFHYTGTPNRLTSGRDVPREVAARLQRAGFTTTFAGDGVLAVGTSRAGRSR